MYVHESAVQQTTSGRGRGWRKYKNNYEEMALMAITSLTIVVWGMIPSGELHIIISLCLSLSTPTAITPPLSLCVELQENTQ